MQSLNNYIISAPLSAILTLLTGVSLLIVFDVVGIAIFKRKEIWARALFFFTGLLAFSNITLALSLLHFATTSVFSCLAGVMIVGAVLLVRKQTILQDIYAPFRTTPDNTTERLLKYAVLAALAAYLIISLAPPTDADSLDYHLGIPVTILNNNNIWQNPDNLHFRLYGFGEILNTFGVGIGCAQFGSFIQFIALLWLLVVFATGEKKTIVDTWAMCLSVPVLLFLASTQKHQLTGVAATAIIFYVLCYQYKTIDKRMLWVLAATLLFAAGLKYSFIISTICLLILSSKLPNYKSFLLGFAALFACLFLPIALVKYYNYGNPVSPLFSGILEHNSFVSDFYTSLRGFKDNKFPFPVNLIIPSSAGFISTIIGIGTLLTLASITQYKQYKREVFVIVLFCTLTTVSGQKTARFFLEPYYWSVCIFLGVAISSNWLKYLRGLIVWQFVLVLPLIVLSAGLLIPGIVSDNGRDAVMNKYAAGYAECKWIDNTIPKDAVILTDIRSRALLPRRYMPIEYMRTDSSTLATALQKYHVAYLILAESKGLRSIDTFKGEKIASAQFNKAARNPLNKATYILSIYHVRN